MGSPKPRPQASAGGSIRPSHLLAARITGLPDLRSAPAIIWSPAVMPARASITNRTRFGFRDRRDGLFGHAVGDGTGCGVFETGGVDQAQAKPVIDRIHRLAVARHARRVMHDGRGAPGEAVEQPRFADIRPAHDSKYQRRAFGLI